MYTVTDLSGDQTFYDTRNPVHLPNLTLIQTSKITVGNSVSMVIGNPRSGTTKFFPTDDDTIIHLHMRTGNYVGVTDGWY